MQVFHPGMQENFHIDKCTALPKPNTPYMVKLFFTGEERMPLPFSCFLPFPVSPGFKRPG